MLKRRTIDEDFEDEEKLAIHRYLIFVFNGIFFVAGSLIFALGMYVTNDNDMEDCIQGLSMDFYLNATRIFMFAAAVVVLNSIIGACGGFLLSTRTLLAHIILTIISFLLLLITSAYMLANGLDQSRLFTYIQEEMRVLIYDYMNDMAAKTAVDKIQEFAGCCGGYSADDYINIHSPVPDTCRNHVTGNQYSDSCGLILSGIIEKRTGWMCGLALCTCFLEIFLLIASLYARKYILRLRRKL